MPTGGLIINDAGSTAARSYGIFVHALDVSKQPGQPGGTGLGCDPDSVIIRERVGEDTTCEFYIDDPAKTLTVERGDDVYIVDFTGYAKADGTRGADDLFRGYVDDAVAMLDGLGWRWRIVALGLDGLLSRRFLTSGVIPAGTSTRDAVQVLLGNLDPRVLTTDRDPEALTVNRISSPNLIVSAGSLLTPVALTGKTYRQAYDDLLSATSIFSGSTNNDDAIRYDLDIDAQGRVRSNPRIPTGPLGSIKEGIGAPAAEPAPADIEYAVDRSNYVSRVYVQGIDATSSGWVVDYALEAAYGRVDDYITPANVVDAASRDTAGWAYLRRKRPVSLVRMTLSDTHDRMIPTVATNAFAGWHVRTFHNPLSSDSGLFPTSGSTGVSAYLWEMTKRFTGGGTHMQLELVFGGTSPLGSARVATALADIAESSKSAGRLVGSLDEAAIRTKAGVPTDADFDTPRDGIVVVDTTDSILYMRSGGVWLAHYPVTIGTATPTINNGGTATFSGVQALYWQMGRIVVAQLVFGVTAVGSGAVGVTVTGCGFPLPATVQTILGNRGGVGVTNVSARIDNASGDVDQIRLVDTAAVLTGADMANGASYRFVGAYLSA